MNSILPASQLAGYKGLGFFRTIVRVLMCIAPILAMQVASATETVTYYYSDQQGTVLATTNASGALTSTSDYRPYGTQTLGSLSDGPGYTGHVNDVDSSLVYMQARYYDPAMGAFLSVDPTSVSAGNVYNFSRYAYASNNPIVNIDPDGRDTVGENIDQNAQAAADAGNHVATFGWAFAGAAWQVLGAEPVSQVVDKGAGASHADMAMAAIAVVTLGKGEEAATVGKGVVEAAEDVAKEAGTLFHYTDAEGAAAIKSSGVIKPGQSGGVYLTTDKIASEDANNALFMGQGGSKGTHVVKVNLKDGSRVTPGTQANELIHQGAIRDGRHATITVQKNDH